MRISVTGGTGFIGSALARGLASAGHELRFLARPGREGAVPKELPGPGGAPLRPEVHTGDLVDPASLRGFLRGQDLLVHVASAHDHFGEAEMRAVNIGGTEALIGEAKKDANEGFAIWVVSSAVIGAPVYSYYRDSK